MIKLQRQTGRNRRHNSDLGLKNERRKEDVPDAVNVLDGIADLLTQLFFVKLHLQHQRNNKYRMIYLFIDNCFRYSITLDVIINGYIEMKD